MEAFRVGQLQGYTYGLIVAGAAALALLLMLAQKKKYALKTGTVACFGALALPLCVLCAHTLFWVCSIDWLKKTGASFWSFTGGGYMLYGAVIGGFAAAFIASRLTGEPFSRIADAAAAPAALVIAAGRFAEYLVGVGYGAIVSDWFDPMEEWSMIAWEDPEAICCFPFAMQTGYYGTWRFAICVLEGLAALIFLVVLLRSKKRAGGGTVTLLMLMYAVCQVVFESMRRDDVVLWSFVKVSQLLSALIVLGILFLCWLRLPEKERTPKALLIPLLMLVLAAGIVMLMEFVLDQKIGFMLWMRADLSYIVSSLCCVWMLLTVLPLWRRAFPAEDRLA